MRSDRLTIGLKWAGTVITLAGALCTSLRVDPLNVYLLNIGALLFLWWAFRIRDRAMITVNAGLLGIYILGLFFTR
jgi:hypothetical protein